MIKKIVIYFLVIFIAVWIGLRIQADPGYVLISYHGFGLETTLWFAILVILLLFFVFYLLLRFIHNSRILPKRIQFWWHGFRERRAIKNTNRGLMHLAEGVWTSAEKCLNKAVKYSPNQFLNYVNAAIAAHKQEAFGRRDSYFDKARLENDKSELAVGIMQAGMQIKSGQFEKALVNLKHLHAIKPKQPVVLNLLQRVYCEIADWESLRSILPLLRKRKAMPADARAVLEEKVYLELLNKLIGGHDYSTVQKFWLDMPRYLQTNVELAFSYVSYLMERKANGEAEQVLRAALKKSWNPKLLQLYAAIDSEHPLRHLAYTEHWLKAHAGDAALYLCLGRLCKKQELWGKARSYLERSIELAPSMAAYLELGEILASQGDMKLALENYRRGVVIAPYEV